MPPQFQRVKFGDFEVMALLDGATQGAKRRQLQLLPRQTPKKHADSAWTWTRRKAWRAA
ncbi:hypothetical protein [Sabulicella rubraurantiaca]|uniref:hypothetical protein n=1 Tax=Sabulicella rubraurantiaca TaxID=2811429 RepID=UPI001A970741|nr:hypothetical protein [Sabulicella rubraurantiaca]